MTLVCAAQFVLQLDFSIVNVALPTIQADLHMAAAQLQWIVTGYALTFGSLLLAGVACAVVAVQMHPRGGQRQPGLQRASSDGAPAASLAESQLRRC